MDSSAEDFNLGLYMKLKLQLSSLLPPGVHTPGIWQLCLPRSGGGGEFDIRELKQQWQQQKRHLQREVALLQTLSYLFHPFQFVKCWQ